ncbi:MAG: peptidyl-prolyl cis-trans isomerase [Lachnospiraceae bacterium]|nr:peptidyl-prolyl cis-trans isomerase [Lachnospiraceae bacterium]
MAGFRRQTAGALLAAFLVSLSGCGNGIPIVSEGKAGYGYTDAQNMLIVATERNRYQAVYTDQIWQVSVDDAGRTFQDCLLEEVRGFLSELQIMNQLADERGITTDGQDREELAELADAFYASLTKEDLDYIGITRDEVYDLYEQYDRANRLVDELTQDVNLEISDSEARVITVQEIIVTDPDTAQAAYEQATAEKADFEAVAKNLSEEKEITGSIGRGERPAAYEQQVFALETGEISPVFQLEDRYYIVKCINSFDEKATLERKEKLALQRKNQAFRGIYEEFAAEHPVETGGTFWDRISFAEGEASTTAGFFEWYQEYRKH